MKFQITISDLHYDIRTTTISIIDVKYPLVIKCNNPKCKFGGWLFTKENLVLNEIFPCDGEEYKNRRCTRTVTIIQKTET